MANQRTVTRRNQRLKQSRVKEAELWAQQLPEEVINKLASLDHPKIDADEHSMYSYVLWLCSKGYQTKAEEVVNGNTSPN